jgi:hypothetical protein
VRRESDTTVHAAVQIEARWSGSSGKPQAQMQLLQVGDRSDAAQPSEQC